MDSNDITTKLLALRIFSALCGAAILWSLKSLWDQEPNAAFFSGAIALVLFYLSSVFEDQIISK